MVEYTVRRSVLLCGAAIALAIGASACSDSTTGTASPASSDSSSPQTQSSSSESSSKPGIPTKSSPSGSQSGPLADKDPCDLLSGSETSQLDVGDGESGKIGFGRRCRYKGDGTMLDVVIFDTLGLKDQETDGQVKKTKVGGHDATESQTPLGGCVVAIGISDSTRVDIGAAALQDAAKACTLSREAAQLLEPKLPAS